MFYDVAQTALETLVQSNWTATQVQYDNVAFNSELYHEFMICTVRFGEARSRAVSKGCYRQFGILLLTIKVKPGNGTSRKLELAKLAADMVNCVEVPKAAPSDPVVKLKVPELYTEDRDRDGWVMAQVSCPFYYDFTS